MSEFTENKVGQVANQVGGDQAGRDIIKTYVYGNPVSQMSRLITKYREDAAKDIQVLKTIDRLQRWFKSEGHVMGLDEKLRRGNRTDIIILATEAKHRFAKCLVQHEYSPAAQEIYAFLLAKIYQIFQTIIFPAICRDESPNDIDRLLVSEVYDKVDTLLEDNPLGITPEEVMGMLYWLTGNCHLYWSKNANI